MRIMVKAPALNQKSSWAIGENGFVPIKKRSLNIHVVWKDN